MRIFLFITLVLFATALFAPTAFAEESGGFVALAPIPNLDTTEDATLTSYLQSIFNFAIVIGGVLAVLMLVRSGFTYMTSDALSQKSDARTQIQSAITGLILLLLSWLFLYVINPNLLNLDLFKNLNNEPASEPTGDPNTSTIPSRNPGDCVFTGTCEGQGVNGG